MAGSRWAGPFERSLSPSNPGRFRHGSKVARLGTGTALVACLFIDSITAQQQQTNKTRGGTDTDNDTQTLLNGVSAQSTSTSASSAANGQTPWVTALLCVVFSLIGLFMIWRYGIRRCLANRRVRSSRDNGVGETRHVKEKTDLRHPPRPVPRLAFGSTGLQETVLLTPLLFLVRLRPRPRLCRRRRCQPNRRHFIEERSQPYFSRSCLRRTLSGPRSRDQGNISIVSRDAGRRGSSAHNPRRKDFFFSNLLSNLTFNPPNNTPPQPIRMPHMPPPLPPALPQPRLPMLPPHIPLGLPFNLAHTTKRQLSGMPVRVCEKGRGACGRGCECGISGVCGGS